VNPTAQAQSQFRVVSLKQWAAEAVSACV
jgi:hypothetical protein